MNPPPLTTEVALSPAPPASRVLRRLFLTLFLRGRTARGLQKSTAPNSVLVKLWLSIGLYLLLGLVAFTFVRQPVFTLSVYLHGMTFVLLALFIAASAGEILFNRDEAEILLHRPVKPSALLWAKIGVLVQVSLWLAFAFNAFGLYVGTVAPHGSGLFPIVHAASTFLEALFCTGSVVLVYQLCLKWFGRERLEGMMTFAQVVVSIAAVSIGQLMPRLMTARNMTVEVGLEQWWLALLPPAWFAALDDALAGSRSGGAWVLASVGILATAVVLALAFGKLAGEYEKGIQLLAETSNRPGKRQGRGRLLGALAGRAPLKWWLRDPVTRASFLLTAGYLARDRETKLRVYPGIAPMLIFPLVIGLQGAKKGEASEFGLVFIMGYVGLVPMLAINLLRYSAQWSAADVFRYAPAPGPGPLCEGVRKAVMLFLTTPLLLLFLCLITWLADSPSDLVVAIPGLLLLPIYSVWPCISGQAVPFSMPSETAKSTSGGLRVIGAMALSMAVSGLAVFAKSTGWLAWLIAGEAVAVLGAFLLLRRMSMRSRWSSIE